MRSITRWCFIFALLLMTRYGFANACSSAATGNWNAAATWTSCGGTYPGNGDTYTINSGHTVTVPGGISITVGNSPAGCTGGSSCVYVGSHNGPLVINGTLVVRGSINQGNAPVTFGPASAFSFDSTAASSPTTTTYAWVNNGFGAGARMFNCNGTSGNPVLINSVSGGGNGYFWAQIGYNDSMLWNCQYAKFTRIGDTTNLAIQFNPASGTYNELFSHVIFDTCGGLGNYGSAMPSTVGFSFTNTTFRNSYGTANADGSGNRGEVLLSAVTSAPIGGALRVWENNVSDMMVVLPPNSLTLTGNIMLNGWKPTYASWGASTPYSSFANNLYRVQDETMGEALMSGPSSVSNYFLLDGSHTPLTSGAVGSVSNPTNSFIVTASGSPGWTVNSYSSGTGTCGGSGSYCEYDFHIESGLAAGEVHSVVSNTSNTLTLLYPLRGNLQPGDSFSVYVSQYNHHWAKPDSNMTSFTYSNNIFENTGTDSNGDIMFAKDACAFSLTMNGNLSLPNAALDNPGTITNVGSCGTSSYVYQGAHNTLYSGAQAGMDVAEGATGAAGQVAYWRSNITWNVPSSMIATWVTTGEIPTSQSTIGPLIMGYTGTGGSEAAGIVTRADYNATWNMLSSILTSTPGGGYNLQNYGTGIFGNGINGGTGDKWNTNPQFVDYTRNIWKWGLSLGLTGTRMSVIQQVLNNMALLNDSTFNNSFTLSNLQTYVTNGFAPTNIALHNAAHDGTDIGAVPYVSAGRAAAPVHRAVFR
jgi:hypothetical protein